MRNKPTIKDLRTAVRAMRANRIRLRLEILDLHTVTLIKELWEGPTKETE